jgi:diacylglycerol kinase (ATP)
VAVLTNPAAGGRRHRRLVPEIIQRLGSSGRELTLVTAHSGAEAEQACRTALDGGATALVAVGGDGTLHAAIQAVAGTEVPFAVVPAGTGNDFATALGVPDDPVAAADRVATGLKAGTTRQLDLARVTGADGEQRWFAAVFGAGFDALVNERANRMRWPRGDRRYDLAILLELLTLRPRHYRIRLDDGEPMRLDAVLVAVGNSPSYGGGIRICPTADPADGLLDVVIGHRMGRATLATLWPRAYRGTHLTHPRVDSHRVRRVEIEAADVVGYADGERCLPLPVTITCEPAALRVVTP